MDLTQFTQVGTFDVSITHPSTGDDLGLVITVSGSDSREYVGLLRKQEKARAARMMKNGRFVADAISPEDMERDRIALLAESTRGWRTTDGSPVLLSGQELPFSRENAVLLYETLPFLREQVQEAVQDRSNFFASK